MGAYGLNSIHPVDNPHIIGMASARTTETDLVLDIRNGPDAADRILGLQKDGEIWAQDGTAADPTYTFEDDIDSGWYRIGANNVGLSLGGSKVVDYGTGGVAVTGTLSATGAVTIGSTVYPGTFTQGDLIAATGSNTIAALNVGSARQLLQTNAAGTDPEWASNIDVPGTLGVTGVASFSDGSAGSPAISFSSDPDSGMWRVASNIIALGAGGTESLRVSAGNAQILDNNTLSLGNSSDSTVKYDGTNTIWDLRAVGTGNLLFPNGSLFLGDTANANMTIGLTINQGANDDHILTFKSSDVDHGGPAGSEADTYAYFKKKSATLGGLDVTALQEASGTPTAMSFTSIGGAANTTKTTAGSALIEISTFAHDGGGNLANVAADGNVFGVKAQVGGSSVMRMMVDEDGDLYSVTAAQTFDREDDLALVRALDLVRGDDVVRQEWDDFVRYNEADLIRLGILGGPVSEGGMTNVTQLQRLHNGALVQLHTAQRKTQSRTEKLEGVLRDLLAQNPTLNGREQALALLEA